jgi:hypothetical protein
MGGAQKGVEGGTMTVDLSLKGSVIIVGGYGGGKTEIAINLALFMKKRGIDVRVADLDIVNLYFRTREARSLFAHHQIPCILPEKAYLHADFPALSPEIGGLFKSKEGLTLLDCGGDPVGARVIGTLKEAIGFPSLQMLLVVNPFRPDSGTEKEVRAIKEGIEKSSGLSITGIVGNANLMAETRVDTIISGYEFVRRLAEKEGVGLSFITAPDTLANAVMEKRLSCPVLPITRRLLPPWMKS